MKKVFYAAYDGEEIQAEFTQTFELVDYGSGTKQDWQSMGDIEVVKLSIAHQPATMAMLHESLHDGIIELSNECEWVA